MMATYSYDPSNLEENGLDLMRFELGDTMTDGKEKTCALCDEEYKAIISRNKKWKKAKLACIESIFRRFSYEPDTTTGPLHYAFGDRAKLWQEEYRTLKAELSQEGISVGAVALQTSCGKEPYFYAGMMSMEKGRD